MKQRERTTRELVKDKDKIEEGVGSFGGFSAPSPVGLMKATKIWRKSNKRGESERSCVVENKKTTLIKYS